MRLTRFATLLLSASVVANSLVTPVARADGDNEVDKQKNRPAPANPADVDPQVQGRITKVYWADGATPGQKTATATIFSNDSNVAIQIYADNPSAREMLVSGQACTGRFIVAVGERIEVEQLSALSIKVLDPETPCTETLVPVENKQQTQAKETTKLTEQPAPTVASTPAQPQSQSTSPAGPCAFVAGFKTLHDLIPNIVGDCTENEGHNPDNGDGLQKTVGGLLVWRKADNWTAFTNGAQTWINGPQGLQSRSNNDRFTWEGGSATGQTNQPAQAGGSDQVGQAAPGIQTSYPSPTGSSSASPSTAATPATTSSSTQTESGARGTVIARPSDVMLKIDELGKEIKADPPKTGSDARASWAEARFERDIKRLDDRLGPILVYVHSYVATSEANAQRIYADELGKQRNFPEAGRNKVSGGFLPEGIGQVAPDQDSWAACNADCGSKEFTSVHMRTVMRYSNCVVVLYIYGGRDSATPEQLNQWLPRLRERMYE
jgi:hypothetical protein